MSIRTMRKRVSGQQKKMVVIAEAASHDADEIPGRDHVASSLSANHHFPSSTHTTTTATTTMSVTLNPSNSLGFRRPLTTLVKRSLTITNNNSQPVAFKVKTTAPKLYCVRPNSGRVEPGESVDVSVMLQALKEEPPLNTKCKDKFLIQSTIITPDKETLPLNEIWASPDLTPEEGKVFSQKLRVAYLPAEGQIEEEEEQQPSMISQDNSVLYDTVRNPSTNGLPNLASVLNPQPTAAPAAEQAEPIARPVSPPQGGVERESSYDILSHESVPSNYDHSHAPPRTPSPPPVHAHADTSVYPEPVTAVASAADSTVEETHQPPVIPVAEPEPAPVPVPPAPAPIIIHKENPVNEQLYAKLKSTEAENAKLRNELQEVLRRLQENESELLSVQQRKRERVESDADSIAASDAQTVLVDETPIHQDGVPPQVVVVIAVGVFVMTYLFF